MPLVDNALRWVRVKSIGENLFRGDDPMADATLRIEERVARLEGKVEDLERDLPSRMDRLETKMDRLPWFILVTWITIILAQIGIYFQILQIISKLK